LKKEDYYLDTLDHISKKVLEFQIRADSDRIENNIYNCYIPEALEGKQANDLYAIMLLTTTIQRIIMSSPHKEKTHLYRYVINSLVPSGFDDVFANTLKCFEEKYGKTEE